MGWFKRKKPQRRPKVLIIGLDCLAPQLVAQFSDAMPNLSALQRQGAFGLLESVIPPITVPAWACMTTGKHPGTLGVYGFRNRVDHSYDKLAVVTSAHIREKAIWDYVGEAGRESIVVGVPPGFPPKPLKGHAVSCFLTPDARAAFTYPKRLKDELQMLVGEYQFDVRNFRTENKQWLLDQIFQLTEQRFCVAEHLLKTKPWDFFMFVDMGPDRLHHGFWKYCDPQHIHHQIGNPFEKAFEDYYSFLDRQLGKLLACVADDVFVFVVSDHGAKRMDGGICINEWLIQQGYLKLKVPPQSVRALDPSLVDWAHTSAWGEGGYYSRLFLNVAGREPQGTVTPSEYESIRDELVSKLEALGNEQGHPIGTRVYRPEDLYASQQGIAPDLIALFGDLHWRSVGTIGWNSVWVRENDTGPDDANHAQHGVFAAHNVPGFRGQKKGQSLVQITPTVLQLLELPVPDHLEASTML